MTARDAYIVEAVRTPVGRRAGGLSGVHPADLGAHVIRATIDRTGVEPDSVEDVVFGCVNTMGAQAGNIARTSWLSAGFPEDVPGVTVDRRCGSSQQAISFAAQAISAETYDLVLAGGVEVMSLVPLGSPAKVGAEHGFGSVHGGKGWRARYGDEPVTQFRGAELIAERWGLERPEMEAFALRSHENALAAQREGRFDTEIVPFDGFSQDEGPRADTSLEKMSSLSPVVEGGRLTPALSSQISDGAACLVLASDVAVERYGLTPRARIHTSVAVGSDPIMMLTGPISATHRVLERSGLDISDIDLFEINEAFASVVLAWFIETKAPQERTNVNGGAISLGHPVGATGARLMSTLLHELERTGGRYGLQVVCEGGGTANATIIERL
jgi:acetyl-CoA C-acetyltransferase